jgi:polyisoprenoid-binding protein YceI
MNERSCSRTILAALVGLIAFGSTTGFAHAGSVQGFAIVSKKSEVRFIIDELLFGKPKSVVGRTSKISGSVGVDMTGATGLRWLPIRVDAQDLTTDNSFRNKALRNQILGANRKEFHYIVFKPARVEGLVDPRTINIGEPFTFRVIGDLTIRGVTRPVAFDMTLTATSARELEGSGTAIITRSEFELWLPKVRNVADVSEEIVLEIDLVMAAIGAAD